MSPSVLQQKLAAMRKKDASLRAGNLETLQEFAGQVLSTGNIAMDNALGNGGIPRGRVVELYGPSGSGKTTIALQTAARYQQAAKEGQIDGAVLYLDYEYSLDRAYCEALGLDLDDEDTFIYVQPRHFEQGAQVFRDLMADRLIGLGIFDSVAAMVNKSELEADSGAITVGDRAKALHQFMRQAKGPMALNGVTAIFLNHVMDVIETTPMGRRLAMQGVQRKTTPGGTALKFYADIRVEFSQAKTYKTEVINDITQEADKIITSTDVDAKVVKNKVATPQRIAHMRVRYGKGFSQPYSIYQVLVAYGRFKKSGTWITVPADVAPEIGEQWKVQGEETVIGRLERDLGWQARMEAEARRLVASDETEDIEFDPNIDPETGEVLNEQPGQEDA